MFFRESIGLESIRPKSRRKENFYGDFDNEDRSMSNHGYDDDITGSREDNPRSRRDTSETRVIEGRKHHVSKDEKGREVNALNFHDI